MSDWNSDPDDKPDPEIRAEGIIVGGLVGCAYIYAAYLIVTQLFPRFS